MIVHRRHLHPIAPGTDIERIGCYKAAVDRQFAIVAARRFGQTLRIGDDIFVPGRFPFFSRTRMWRVCGLAKTGEVFVELVRPRPKTRVFRELREGDV